MVYNAVARNKRAVRLAKNLAHGMCAFADKGHGNGLGRWNR
jgi:hypothetical protein